MGLRRHRRKLYHEQLESRLALSATIVFEPHQIDLTSRGSVTQARSAYAADVDGDGDLDVFSVSRNEGMIAWHDNIGGGTFRRPRNVISTEATRADFVFAADVDGDADPDVIYASSREDLIVWHENLGNGSFGGSNVISSEVDSPINLTVADLDGDGDLDVLSASEDDDTIAWYENTDAAGTFGSQRVVTDEADGAMSVWAADIDGDGDVDIISASPGDDTIAWHENQDGRGAFGDRTMISIPNPITSRSNFVSTADLDGDGDLDVLSASYIDKEVAWYENLDGQGTFGLEQVIMHDLFRRLSPRVDTVLAADLDGDGDLDVVSADEFNHETYWSENTDGRGPFGAQQLIGPTGELTGGSFQFADIDNDGDLDILAASDHEGIIAWHENRVIGDSNDDGVFNTSDLVHVFQVGEYLDAVPDNSTFADGDWNLDGDFTSSDLVFAFQAGTFTVPASQSASRFSAAADWLFRDNDLQKKQSATGKSQRSSALTHIPQVPEGSFAF
jgi:hypothetical protein